MSDGDLAALAAAADHVGRAKHRGKRVADDQGARLAGHCDRNSGVATAAADRLCDNSVRARSTGQDRSGIE